ncbi:MAG: PaaI family thioesterase, partial [Gemmatimonadetes bacterium]|nr:PaaI family thioesterase [Gemmatimonadota bacterium]
ACGYAALTLMEPGAAVLSVEFKVNLLAPASGKEFVAIGKVVRAGRTITVVSGELVSLDDGKETVVAILQGTMMAVRDKAGLSD